MTMTLREHHPFVGKKTGCGYRTAEGRACKLTPIEHEVGMMQDPDAWPAWPVLPLKRSGKPYEFPEVGFIVEQPPAEAITVYLATIFETEAALRGETPQLRYASLDEMYEDGWRVD